MWRKTWLLIYFWEKLSDSLLSSHPGSSFGNVGAGLVSPKLSYFRNIYLDLHRNKSDELLLLKVKWAAKAF